MLRNEAQWFKCPGAPSVVFEEIRIDVDLIEQDVGREIVAAHRARMALVVATADMHRELNRGGPSGKRAIHDLRIDFEQESAAVVATLTQRFPAAPIAERSECRFVDLDVAACSPMPVRS